MEGLKQNTGKLEIQTRSWLKLTGGWFLVEVEDTKLGGPKRKQWPAGDQKYYLQQVKQNFLSLNTIKAYN